MTTATAATAPRSTAEVRSAASTPFALVVATAAAGLGSRTPSNSTQAATRQTTATQGTSGRVAGASSNPPRAGPTTNDATSHVTSRPVARSVCLPASSGMAAARAGYAGVATATARVAATSASQVWPIVSAAATPKSSTSRAARVSRTMRSRA